MKEAPAPAIGSNFELFRNIGTHPGSYIPWITVSSQGHLRVSRAGYELLGAPTRVSLVFDKANAAIGMQSAIGGEDSYKLFKNGHGSSFYISCRRFFQYLGLEAHASHRFTARMDDGILWVDLASGGTPVGKGRRSTLVEGSQ